MIPKTWKQIRLGSIAQIIAGGTPRRNIREYWKNGDIPWLKSGELNDYIITKSEERITEKGLKNSSARIFPKGTLLFALYGRGTVTKTGLLAFNAATNQAIAGMLPKNSNFNPKYIQYYLILIRRKILYQLVNPSSDVGRTNIYKSSLETLKIILPPFSEQQKIVEVLSNVDAIIQQTKALTNQLQLHKKGLMQQLFTEGIGHTEFKETKLGRIPKEWELKKLKDVCLINPESLHLNKYPLDFISYIDISSIDSTTFRISRAKKISISKIPSRARRIIRTNDIIISTVRPYLQAFAKVDKKHDQHICSTGFAVLRNKDQIKSDYLFNWIFNKIFMHYMINSMVGSNYPAVNSSDVELAPILVPSLPEQNKIAIILSNVDNNIQLNDKYLNELKRIKKGLMQQLLTGKKRSPIN